MGVLDGKVAIVTGSARGIGRATAELLGEHGAKVVINDLDADVAQQTSSELPGETVVHGGDLTKPGAPDDLVRAHDLLAQLQRVLDVGHGPPEVLPGTLRRHAVEFDGRTEKRREELSVGRVA